MDRSSPAERLGRSGSGGEVSIGSKDGWRLGKGKWALLCSRFFRALIFLNTEHLNHMFGNIRESSGKHQPFHFYFQREPWVLDGGGVGGERGRRAGRRFHVRTSPRAPQRAAALHPDASPR